MQHTQSAKGEKLVCAPSSLPCALYSPRASWLNWVERLFAEITERCVRRGSHTAIAQLENAMLDYLRKRNRDPNHLCGPQTPISSSAKSSGFLNESLTQDTSSRFHLHFTPTYSSWLNQVERWFVLITQQAIRRGSFKSVKELITRINQFVQRYNSKSKPFAWTATADSIFQKLARLCNRSYGHNTSLLSH